MVIDSRKLRDEASQGTTELDDFLTMALSRQMKAECALVNGDLEPRMSMWSSNDLVTLFRAGEAARVGGMR